MGWGRMRASICCDGSNAFVTNGRKAHTRLTTRITTKLTGSLSMGLQFDATEMYRSAFFGRPAATE